MKRNIIKSMFLVLVLLCCSDVRAFDYGFYAGFGTSYINSKGLNRITEGLDQGYVTSFGKIRFPLNFEGAAVFGFGHSKVGLGIGYEFASRSSYSEVYSVTETVSYRTTPIFVLYRYVFFKRGHWEIASGANAGVLYSTLSMQTQPSVQNNETFGMKAWGFSFGADTDLSYAVSNNVRLFSSLGLRYGKTGSFSYSSDTSKHTKGEKVLFSDSSNLTLNLSGLKFLIGIMLSWS